MAPHLLSLARNSALAVGLLAGLSAPALPAPSGLSIMPVLSDQNNPNPLVIQVRRGGHGGGGRHMGGRGGMGGNYWRRGGHGGAWAGRSFNRGYSRGHFARGHYGRGYGGRYYGRGGYYRHAYHGGRYYNRYYGRNYGRYYGGYYNRYPYYRYRNYDNTSVFLNFGIPWFGLYGACTYYNPYSPYYCPYPYYYGY